MARWPAMPDEPDVGAGEPDEPGEQERDIVGESIREARPPLPPPPTLPVGDPEGDVVGESSDVASPPPPTPLPPPLHGRRDPGDEPNGDNMDRGFLKKKVKDAELPSDRAALAAHLSDVKQKVAEWKKGKMKAVKTEGWQPFEEQQLGRSFLLV